MKKIMLFCAGGASTGLLVNRMNSVSDSTAVEISAHSIVEVASIGKDADCILLGPQVGYQLKKVQQELSDKPVGVIDMRTYGRMEGEKVLQQAMSMMNKFKVD